MKSNRSKSLDPIGQSILSLDMGNDRFVLVSRETYLAYSKLIGPKEPVKVAEELDRSQKLEFQVE